MRHTITILVGIGLFLTLSAYLAPDVSPADYPAEIVGIGDSPNYPLRAAGFKRDKMLTYAPGMTNISISYNLRSLKAQITATIYRYKKKEGAGSDLSTQFKVEKSQLERLHPGAKLLAENSVRLVKNGKNYSALKVSYRLSEAFMNRRQEIYSELLLWSYGDNYIKLRSTCPFAQKKTAERKNIELLNTVNWAN